MPPVDETVDASTPDARVSVVTGGASGIGAATVALLAAQGERVIVLDRAAPDAPPAAANGRVQHIVCDLAREDAVVQAFARIAREHGRVHGLVNSAGVESRHLLADMTLDAWDRVIDINLRGT